MFDKIMICFAFIQWELLRLSQSKPKIVLNYINLGQYIVTILSYIAINN
jgi:hypothetical protein